MRYVGMAHLVTSFGINAQPNVGFNCLIKPCFCTLLQIQIHKAIREHFSVYDIVMISRPTVE